MTNPTEEWFRSLYDNIPSMFFTVAPDGTMLSVNRWGAQQLGCHPDDLIGRSVLAHVYEDDHEAVRQGLAKAFANQNRLTSLEFRTMTREGTVIWMRGLVRVVPAAAGTGPVALIVCEDITDRKRIEEALRAVNATLEQRVKERAAELTQANERFEVAAQAMHAGMYDRDLLHDTVYLSPHWKEMHRFAATEVRESSQNWAARIHPDDREHVLSQLQNYLAGKHHEFWEEYRIYRKDGTLMWVLDRAIAFWDEQGRAVRMVGAETDITWRKEAEEAIRRKEHEYRTLADNVPAFFGYIDREQRYRFVNKRYEKLFARSDEELAGMAMRDLLGSEGYAEVQPHVEAALAGETVSFEYRLPMPDASERWFSAQYVPDRNQDGTIAGLFVLLADITLLKQSEAALHLREEQLHGLSTMLLLAQEEERRRIARELHDDITQRLAALTLELRSVLPTEPEFASLLSCRLKKLGESAEQLTTDLQQMAHRLHPSILEHAGLEAAVHEHVDEFTARTGLATELMVRDVPKSVPLDQATCLYRVLQESLQNVWKHANATTVLIRLLRTERGLGLCVHDDGQGFERAQATVGQKGLGLTSMLERVGALHGTFRIKTRPGDGTEVHAWVPLPSGEE